MKKTAGKGLCLWFLLCDLMSALSSGYLRGIVREIINIFVAACIGMGFAADTEAIGRIGERHDAIRDAAGRREGVELEIVVVVFLVEVIGVAEDA